MGTACFHQKRFHQSLAHQKWILRHSTILQQAADSSEGESSGGENRESKRKRFLASLKKIFSHPKNTFKRKLEQRRQMKVNQSDAKENGLLDSGSSMKLVNGAITANGDSQAFMTNGAVSWEGGTNSSPQLKNGKPQSASSEQVESEKKVNSVQLLSREGKKDIAENQHSMATTAARSSTTVTTDLSGTWRLIVTDDFKTKYDTYLQLLGQPSLVRSVALSIIGMTSEETFQSEDGQKLTIRGRNVRGNWERTLHASCNDDPLIVPIVTADQETVMAECWWEDNGTVHRSWLRNTMKYGGGSFESKRYLEDHGNILVCESCFHPSDNSRPKACVTWRFQRSKPDANSVSSEASP